LELASDCLALGHQHLLACEKRDADSVPRWRLLGFERPPGSLSAVARYRIPRRVRPRCAPENKRTDRASTAAIRATAPTRPPRAGIVKRNDRIARYLRRQPPAVRTTDARGNAPHGIRYCGSSVALLYDERRPHQSLGDRTPGEVYRAGACGVSALSNHPCRGW
jgi:hypothetical protein